MINKKTLASVETAEALKQTEEKFRAILEQGSEFVLIINTNGSVKYQSNSTTRILGFAEKAGLGYDVFSLIHPEDVRHMEEILAQCIAHPGKLFTEKFRYPNKNKDILWLEVRGRNMLDNPAVQGIVLNIMDVIEREQLINTLRESLDSAKKNEEKFRVIANNSTDITWVVDSTDLHFTFLSPAIKKMRGVSIEDGLNESLADCFPPDDLIQLFSRFNEELEREKAGLNEIDRDITFDSRQIKADKSIIDVEITAKFLRDANGNITGIQGSTRDITLRKSVEKKLEENEKKYRLLVDNSTDIIWVIDKNTLRSSYLSPSVKKIRGITVEEGLEQAIEECFPPEHLAFVAETLLKEIEKDKTGLYDPDRAITLEAEQYKKDGSRLWVEIIAKFLRDENSNIISIQGSTRDISDRKKLQQERDAYAEHLEELVAEKTRELTLKIEETDKDIAFAKRVQQGILPKELPQSNLVRVSYRYMPMAQLGGDYISFTKFENDSLGVFIGDVSGHGIKAALHTMTINSSANRLLRENYSAPDKYLNALNIDLCDNMQPDYLTAIYGLISPGKKKNTVSFSFAKAGHPEPIFCRESQNTAAYIKAAGKPLGCFKEFSIFYETVTQTLRKNDRLFLYTDGFIEAKNKSNELLGFKRFLDVVQEAQKCSLNIDNTLDYITHIVDEFREGTPQDDDMVIIGIEAKDHSSN